VPLIYCVIDYTLSQAMADLRQALLHFMDVMNLMSDANACPCKHASMPKEDTFAVSVILLFVSY